MPKNVQLFYKVSYVQLQWNSYVPWSYDTLFSKTWNLHFLYEDGASSFGKRMVSCYYDKTVVVFWVSEKVESIENGRKFIHIPDWW